MRTRSAPACVGFVAKAYPSPCARGTGPRRPHERFGATCRPHVCFLIQTRHMRDDRVMIETTGGVVPKRGATIERRAGNGRTNGYESVMKRDEAMGLPAMRAVCAAAAIATAAASGTSAWALDKSPYGDPPRNEEPPHGSQGDDLRLWPERPRRRDAVPRRRQRGGGGHPQYGAVRSPRRRRFWPLSIHETRLGHRTAALTRRGRG
jgi:hypothetical protein